MSESERDEYASTVQAGLASCSSRIEQLKGLADKNIILQVGSSSQSGVNNLSLLEHRHSAILGLFCSLEETSERFSAQRDRLKARQAELAAAQTLTGKGGRRAAGGSGGGLAIAASVEIDDATGRVMRRRRTSNDPGTGGRGGSSGYGDVPATGNASRDRMARINAGGGGGRGGGGGGSGAMISDSDSDGDFSAVDLHVMRSQELMLAHTVTEDYQVRDV